MNDERLDDPPFESLEERAGGKFKPAGEPGEGGGCSTGCFGCVVVLAVLLGVVGWLIWVAEGKRPPRRGPTVVERSRQEEPESPAATEAQPSAEEPAAAPAAVEAPGAAEVAHDRALDAKIRAIRGATLAPWRTVRDGMLTYHEWCDPATGPKAGKEAPHGPSTLNGVEATSQRIAQVLSSGPETVELDRSARRWVSAQQSLAPVLRDAHDYYARRGHEGDDFAEARELHPRLEKAWKVAADAQRALDDALHLEDVRLKASGRILAALEQDPVRAWELRARRALLASDEVLEAATAPSSAPPAERRALLDRAIESLKQAAAALEPTPAPKGARLLGGLSALGVEARALTEAASERARDMTSPRALTERELQKLKGPLAHQVAGTDARVRKAHERVLDAYLKMRFD